MTDAVADSGGASGAILFAACRLPIGVVADGDVIGLEVAARFGAASVEVRVPPRQDEDPELDTDDLAITMAQSRAEPLPPATGQVVRDWHEAPATDRPAQLEVRRLLLRVSGAAEQLGQPRLGVGSTLAARLNDELYRTANGWHDAFRSWIEAFTMQDLDHVHPRWTAHTEGAGLATFAPDGSRLGHGGIMRLDTYWPAPTSRAQVHKAIVAASVGEYPPLAHQLLRDARAAWYRAQPRKSILDAAAATEISLTALADRAGISPAPGKFLMLGQLVARLDAEGQLRPGESQEITDLVVQPRNKAIHEGVTPNSWDTAEACKVAQRAVWTAFPLEAQTGP